MLADGGPGALLQLAGQHIIGTGPVVTAGDRLVVRPSLWAVTDALRRADNAFGLITSTVSYTYTATETNPADDPLGGAGGPPRQLVPASARGRQTVAVLSGAARVTASSAGSWLGETTAVRSRQCVRPKPGHRLGGGRPRRPGGAVDPDQFRSPDEPAAQRRDHGCSTTVPPGRWRITWR